MDTADKVHVVFAIVFFLLAAGFVQMAFSESGLRLWLAILGAIISAWMVVREYQIVTCPPEEDEDDGNG